MDEKKVKCCMNNNGNLPYHHLWWIITLKCFSTHSKLALFLLIHFIVATWCLLLAMHYHYFNHVFEWSRNIDFFLSFMNAYHFNRVFEMIVGSSLKFDSNDPFMSDWSKGRPIVIVFFSFFAQVQSFFNRYFNDTKEKHIHWKYRMHKCYRRWRIITFVQFNIDHHLFEGIMNGIS